MYIKIIHKDNKYYYLLCIYDKQNQCWAEVFINEKKALCLLQCGVKSKDIETIK